MCGQGTEECAEIVKGFGYLHRLAARFLLCQHQWFVLPLPYLAGSVPNVAAGLVHVPDWIIADQMLNDELRADEPQHEVVMAVLLCVRDVVLGLRLLYVLCLVPLAQRESIRALTELGMD